MSCLTGKWLLFGSFLLLIVSVLLALVSLLPVTGVMRQSSIIIDNSFNLTSLETYRQGLGAFHGDENITLFVNQSGNNPVNFTLLTYTGVRYSNYSIPNINCSFPAGADYYEAVFTTSAATSATVHFQVIVEKPVVDFPFSWVCDSAKVLFILSLISLMLILLKPLFRAASLQRTAQPTWSRLERENLRYLQIAIAVSLVFWFILLAVNTYPLGTFENWYTDGARHPYTSVLFTKVGFSVFNTPLGSLSSADNSFYKFVTWSEMPHLYPIGSVFLFLPFGMLLEASIAQVLVFKLEIALFLIISHLCFYIFLKSFWRNELTLTAKEVYLKPFWKQELGFLLKAFGTYILYIILIVYAANGQFDSVAFLFTLMGIAMFLGERYDYFLLFVAISSSFKYQAGIFLFPLIMISLIRLYQKSKSFGFLRNKAVLSSIGIIGLGLFTAYLSAPSLVSARPELIMNGVNAFSQHAQISWPMQAFAVLLTLSVTLVFSGYLLNKNRLMSMVMLFSLLPAFTMPYFQPWYLPFFFVYPLIPQSKRSLEVTLMWLIFMLFVLSFGGLSYNPLAILDNVRRIFKF
jgi:hypothetical protein